MAFLEHMQALPDIEAIAAGRSSEVPLGIDLQYGVAAALVRHAQAAYRNGQADAVVGNILRYARALPQRELGVMLVTDLHRSIGTPLYAVPEFAEWAQDVSDLLLPDSVGAGAHGPPSSP
jgi:hypothetical protein